MVPELYCVRRYTKGIGVQTRDELEMVSCRKYGPELVQCQIHQEMTRVPGNPSSSATLSRKDLVLEPECHAF